MITHRYTITVKVTRFCTVLDAPRRSATRRFTRLVFSDFSEVVAM